MKPRNYVARSKQSGAGKHKDRREKMSKKFHVIASYINYCETVIEADNLEQAQQMASSMDGGDFNLMLGSGDWSIDCVEEVE